MLDSKQTLQCNENTFITHDNTTLHATEDPITRLVNKDHQTRRQLLRSVEVTISNTDRKTGTNDDIATSTNT